MAVNIWLDILVSGLATVLMVFGVFLLLDEWLRGRDIFLRLPWWMGLSKSAWGQLSLLAGLVLMAVTTPAFGQHPSEIFLKICLLGSGILTGVLFLTKQLSSSSP